MTERTWIWTEFSLEVCCRPSSAGVQWHFTCSWWEQPTLCCGFGEQTYTNLCEGWSFMVWLRLREISLGRGLAWHLFSLYLPREEKQKLKHQALPLLLPSRSNRFRSPSMLWSPQSFRMTFYGRESDRSEVCCRRSGGEASAHLAGQGSSMAAGGRPTATGSQVKLILVPP